MQRILVFGGAFNPPTLAHEAIIEECLKLPGFDEVWVMPSDERDDKQVGVAGEHRLALLNVVKQTRFGDDPRLHISDFELRLPPPSRTTHTVAALQAAYPTDRFWFAFGTDSYRDMPNWKDGAMLQKTLNMVLIARPGAPLPERANTPVLHIALNLTMAATQVRQLIAAGQDITNLVSSLVIAYIRKHRLYVQLS